MSSHSSPTRRAGPIGAATEAARKSPSPKISAWAGSSHQEAIWSACAAASAAHQPVETQPRASSITTRM